MYGLLQEYEGLEVTIFSRAIMWGETDFQAFQKDAEIKVLQFRLLACFHSSSCLAFKNVFTRSFFVLSLHSLKIAYYNAIGGS